MNGFPKASAGIPTPVASDRVTLNLRSALGDRSSGVSRRDKYSPRSSPPARGGSWTVRTEGLFSRSLEIPTIHGGTENTGRRGERPEERVLESSSLHASQLAGRLINLAVSPEPVERPPLDREKTAVSEEEAYNAAERGERGTSEGEGGIPERQGSEQTQQNPQSPWPRALPTIHRGTRPRRPPRIRCRGSSRGLKGARRRSQLAGDARALVVVAGLLLLSLPASRTRPANTRRGAFRVLNASAADPREVPGALLRSEVER